MSRRESAARKPNTSLGQIHPAEAVADSELAQLLQEELDAAYNGILEDVRSIAGDQLSGDALHDLESCIDDRLADIKFGHAALTAFEQPTSKDEPGPNVIHLPLPVTLTNNPAA